MPGRFACRTCEKQHPDVRHEGDALCESDAHTRFRAATVRERLLASRRPLPDGRGSETDTTLNRLRNKLIVVFLLATLAPLAATLWVTKSLFEQSLRLAGQSQAQLDEVSRSLETTGRELYQRACASLKSDAEAG